MDQQAKALSDLREENERLRAQLRQARALETVGCLVGGVTHDFNNVLMTISGQAERLLFSLDESDRNWKAASAIARAAERAAWLTRQLVVFSQHEPQPPRTFDPGGLLDRQVKLLRRLAGSGVSLSVAGVGATRPVRADETLVEQLFLRIAALSREALPGGGTLTISTADDPGTGQACGGVGFVRVTARFTGRSAGQEGDGHDGSGVAVKKLDAVKALFGAGPAADPPQPFVDAELGQDGALVVHLFLPAAGEAPAPAGEAPRQGDVLRAPTGTVLLVEDDDEARDVIARAIQDGGFRVLEARNAGEALLLFEREGERVDLLVADVIMPVMNGIELWDRLSARRPGMAAVFVSGSTEEFNRDAVAARGAVFLSKPFSPAALLAVIRELRA